MNSDLNFVFVGLAVFGLVLFPNHDLLVASVALLLVATMGFLLTKGGIKFLLMEMTVFALVSTCAALTTCR